MATAKQAGATKRNRRQRQPLPTAIPNTCCPVCGTGISSSMPTVELRPAVMTEGLTVTIRVDSAACARVARREPDRYIAAARINQVA